MAPECEDDSPIPGWHCALRCEWHCTHSDVCDPLLTHSRYSLTPEWPCTHPCVRLLHQHRTSHQHYNHDGQLHLQQRCCTRLNHNFYTSGNNCHTTTSWCSKLLTQYWWQSKHLLSVTNVNTWCVVHTFVYSVSLSWSLNTQKTWIAAVQVQRTQKQQSFVMEGSFIIN